MQWKATSPADSVGVGDPFPLVFEGLWPDSAGSARLVWPVAADTLVVLGRDSTAVSAPAGWRGIRYQLTALLPRPGAPGLPPAALVSARGHTLAVSAVPAVRAGGRLPDPANADLEPLAPLVPLRRFPWWIPAAVALALAAAALLWRRVRRRTVAVAAGEPPLPPAIEFERALERLRSLGLAPRGEMRAFAQELSWTLRRYLGRRWSRPALEATRPEILRWLPETRFCMREQGELAAWLERTDRIKFAGEMPLLTEAEELADRAVALVRRTEEIFAAEEAARDAEAAGGAGGTKDGAEASELQKAAAESGDRPAAGGAR